MTRLESLSTPRVCLVLAGLSMSVLLCMLGVILGFVSIVSGHWLGWGSVLGGLLLFSSVIVLSLEFYRLTAWLWIGPPALVLLGNLHYWYFFAPIVLVIWLGASVLYTVTDG